MPISSIKAQPNVVYKPIHPEYPIWIATLFIKNMIRLHPNEDPEQVIIRRTKDMPFNIREVIRKVAADMFINDEL